MKKTFLYLYFILATSTIALAQKEVKLEMKFLPNTTYAATVTTNSTSTINFEGSPEMMEQIKASGMSLPMTVEGKQEISTTTSTGNKDQNGAFTFKTVYDKITATQSLNGQNQAAPDNPLKGMTSFGHISKSGDIQFDSLAGSSVTPQMEQILAQVTESLLDNVEFPDEPMKVGDSFEQKIPMAIPIPGAGNLELVITIDRTLTSIKNGNAYFDLVQKVSLSSNIDSGTMEAIGGGTGSSVYDIKNSFTTGLESNLEMNLVIQTQGMTIKSKIKSNSFNSTKIAR